MNRGELGMGMMELSGVMQMVLGDCGGGVPLLTVTKM